MILHRLILFKFILLFISIQCLVEANLRLSKMIRTPEGQVQGLILKTALRHMEYSSFRGIPYAKPPVGNLRFQPPVKFTRKGRGTHPVYQSVFPAMQDANMCPQFDAKINTVVGNEDCLYLNVYTPEIEFKKGYEKRAVMVWIHGGAFMWGSNNSTTFGPDYLVEKNVVLVAMNYRLGALGFFAAGNVVKGNMGLKDQVMALQWVKDNIVYFGGDPNRVTIFGESAGAVSVELHRLSPLSRGLFESSIAMSGSPLNSWAFSDQEDAKGMSGELIKIWHSNYLGVARVSDPLSFTDMLLEQGKEVIRDLLIEDPTTKEKFNLIKNAKVNDIVRHTDIMSKLQMCIPFLPTVEEPASSGSFLTEMPEDLYKKQSFSGVPHILGYTNDEFIGITEVFHLLYSQLPEMVHDAFELIASKMSFEDGIKQTLKYISKMEGIIIRSYKNSFDYPQSLHRLAGIDKEGCGHADDVAHIFYMQGKNQPLDFQSSFALHRERMVTMWTNFAKYFQPMGNGTTFPFRWPPARKNGYFLEIDDKPEPKNLDQSIWEEFVDQISKDNNK